MKLVLNSITLRQVKNIIQNPVHGVLLEGPDGIGKGTLAKYIAAKVINIEQKDTTKHPFVRIVNSNPISIEDVRELAGFTKLKVAGARTIRRVIIAEHAQKMTHEAQNAFLKLLEEPPADTIIILTVNNATQVLPTIASRVVTIRVFRPTEQELARKFINLGYKEKDIARAYAVSGGLPGHMASILDKDLDFALLNYIDFAKFLLSLSVFEKLIKVDEFIKQKDDPALLLEALDKIVYALLNNAIKTDNKTLISKWHKVSKEISQKQIDLTSNPNNKLLLSDLVLNL